jgi:hypothetical protein
VFLQRLRAALRTYPFGFGGGAGFSFGPQVMGDEAASLDGDLYLALEGQDKYEATGKLKVAEVTMATGHVSFSPGQQLDFGGKFQWEKAGVGVDAGVEGWVAGIRAFNAKGDSSIHVPKLSWGGETTISNKGMAACHRGVLPDVGFGYTWGETFPTIFASSCKLGPWTSEPSLARASAAGVHATLKAKLPLASFAIRGTTAPPQVTLTAPDGLKITTPANGGGIANPRVVLFQNPADGTTYVAVNRPAGGDWAIDPLPGSPAIRGVQHANGLPDPKVKGRVVRSGRRQVLRYTVRPIPGQRVDFIERTRSGHVRVLGTARGARGTLVIKPQPGSRGKRRILADVSQYALPRAEVAVTSYAPPKSASGKVKGLKLVARHGRLKATWKRVRGAKAYRVWVRVSDGRRLLYLQQRARSLTVPRVARGMRVSVQVRAAALPGGTAPSTAKRIKVKR